LLFGVFAIIQTKRKQKIQKNLSGYAKGYWLEKGIGIGVAIGVAMGVAANNIALGIAMGIAIGVAIGKKMGEKHKSEIRPLSEGEKQLKKQSILFILIVFLIAMIIYSFKPFSQKDFLMQTIS